MRSFDPNDEYDKEEAARINAEPWMLDLLAVNPEYTSWGPHEDYMWKVGEDEPEDPNNPNMRRHSGWDARVIKNSWGEFSPSFNLDELNECVNFYFSVRRENAWCPNCDGNGYYTISKLSNSSVCFITHYKQN